MRNLTIRLLLPIALVLCSVMHFHDSVSERPRRWTRNPLGSARRGSNPLAVPFLISVRPASAGTFQASACADADSCAYKTAAKQCGSRQAGIVLQKTWVFKCSHGLQTQHQRHKKQEPAQKLHLRSFYQPSILAAFLCAGCSAWLWLLCCQLGPASRPCRLLPCREPPKQPTNKQMDQVLEHNRKHMRPSKIAPGRVRAGSPWLCWPMPYPLGHRANDNDEGFASGQKPKWASEARRASSVERMALNVGVAGSSPTAGGFAGPQACAAALKFETGNLRSPTFLCRCCAVLHYILAATQSLNCCRAMLP